MSTHSRGKAVREVRLEALERRDMFSASLDNLPRSYHSPIDTIRTPQFVSLGWDDNTDPAGIDWAVKAFGDRTDAHGNPLSTSFYMNSVGFGPPTAGGADQSVSPGESEGSLPGVGVDSTDLVTAFKTIAPAGHEVGNHTFDHHAQVLADKGGWDGMVTYLSNQATVGDWTKFLVDCNAALENPGGQDLAQVTGFRSPFLEYGKNLFPALSQLGFTYDCSIEAISNDAKQFPFPYTLDTGSVDHAAGWKANPDNPNSFQVPNTPGLWEVPAYALRIPDGVEEQAYGLVDIGAKIRAGWSSIRPTDVHVTGFDYNVFLGSDGQGGRKGPGLTGAEVLGLLKYNLDIRLAGNRAPFCFGTHSQYYLENWVAANAPQVTVAEMRQTITDFLDYARSKPEVRIVSGQQIVDWMRNPTPIDDRPQILAPGPVTDVILDQARVALGNVFTGTTTQVRVNDRPWTRIDVDDDGSAALIGLRQGANTAVFRQITTDGMASANQSVRIRFDSIAPPRPLVALRRSGPGGLTNDPALRVARVETDARIEYSINGGAWSDVYAPADGPTVVRLRAVDDAGNASRPSVPVRFTLDRSAAAPAVALHEDTGTPGDPITTDGRLVVTGVETGARVRYSTDEGRTWRTSFTAVDGLNEVLVRQRDRVGNVSAATSFKFTKIGLVTADYSNNAAVVYAALNGKTEFVEQTYLGGSTDGVKGWIVNKTDRPVLVVDKNNPKSTQTAPSAWVLQPGQNMVFYRNTSMRETQGLQSAHGVRFEISDYHLSMPQVSELELRDPFTGRPDTIYSSTWGGSNRVQNIRDDWSEGSVHEEHAGGHHLKIQRLNDGRIADRYEKVRGRYNLDVADWAVFVVEVRRTF